MYTVGTFRKPRELAEPPRVTAPTSECHYCWLAQRSLDKGAESGSLSPLLSFRVRVLRMYILQNKIKVSEARRGENQGGL